MNPQTRKAGASALVTAFAGALAASLPFLTGTPQRVGFAVLAGLASYGITWKTPNAPTTEGEPNDAQHRRL